MAKPTPLHKAIPEPIFSAKDVDPAPDFLSGEMAEVWTEVLLAITPGHIGTESYPTLAAYCQHVVNSRRIGRLIEDLGEELGTIDPLDPLPIKQMDSLLKMLDRENRAVLAAARTLKITNQSLRGENVPKGKVHQSSSAPWKS